MIHTIEIGKLSEFDAYHEKAAMTLMPSCNNIPYLTHGLSSEVGEVDGIWAKSLRGDFVLVGEDACAEKIKSLKLELGDVFYFIDALAIIHYGITLGELIKKHIYIVSPVGSDSGDDLTVNVPARSARTGKRRPSLRRIDADFSKLADAAQSLNFRIRRFHSPSRYNPHTPFCGKTTHAFINIIIAINNLCMDFGTTIREIQLMNNEKLLNRLKTNNIMGDGDHRGEECLTTADPDPEGQKKLAEATRTFMSKSL